VWNPWFCSHCIFCVSVKNPLLSNKTLKESKGTNDTCQKALKLGKRVYQIGTSEGDKEVFLEKG